MRGEPRPPCQKPDGSPLFPPEGSEFDLWWLSEIAKRKVPAEDQNKPDSGDEDGPPTSDSDAEEQKSDAEETDDDA